MEPQSPPKRMTRARAAAKTAEPDTKTTRIVTTAAKARATRTTTTTTTAPRRASKRKTRSDEGEDEDHDELEQIDQQMPSTATATKPARGRGRPKKVAIAEPEAQPEPAPAPTRTRGRPKKTADPVAEDEISRAKPTRKTSAKKAEEAECPVEPTKKTTRGRATTSTAATAAKSLSKPAVKKTVKFEEPEKENIVPATSTSAPSKASTKAPAPATTGGLRGKPIRKAASTTSRTARGTKAAADKAPSSEKEEKPMPLSPKKINQLALNRGIESDDELGMDENVPVRRLKKAPIKAVTTTKSSAPIVTEPIISQKDEDGEASKPETDPAALILCTPAKRLPQSAWKGSIKSPAKRVEGLLGPALSQSSKEDQISQSPVKIGLLQTPAKRQPLSQNSMGTQIGVSPLKISLLSSPAKRSISPIKTLPPRIEEDEALGQSPAPKPTLLASPMPVIPNDVGEEHAPADAATEETNDDHVIPESPTRSPFPGRLSAVLARHADPALTPPTLSLSEQTSNDEAEVDLAEKAPKYEELEPSGDPMILDNAPTEACTVASTSTTPPSSPPGTAIPMFGLREKDLDPYGDIADSDSDDELPRQVRRPSAFAATPTTPSHAVTGTRAERRSAGLSTVKRARVDDKFGFTPLAQQLNAWAADSDSVKASLATASSPTVNIATEQQQESVPTSSDTAGNTFFEDEMHVRPQATETGEDAIAPEENVDVVMEDISFTEEDVALAAEAHEMSLMEAEPAVNAGNHSHDDSLSEASQEYGDENEIPIDPVLAATGDAREPTAPPVTPQRIIMRREVHTVAKVPLKPADESTPRPTIKKRCQSVSRLPASRPTHYMTRNATVISYSPTKGSNAHPFEEEQQQQEEERAESAPPETPQKSDIWSTIGTPARTPRRDLDPALLRGAVVFVDVHTSEGADASGIFVELLTQMGARCVKNWSWNPSNAQADGADSRIGITHVVYKDGGKRTLEKIRESGGVVQCVGVSWVLDCERENKWLDEAPYYIDTSLVPRGGARRRKSMEPRAIANLNGMLMPSPQVRNNNSSFRGCQTAPSTPLHNRRDSALWVRTPDYGSNLADDHDQQEQRDAGSDNNTSDDDDEDEQRWSATHLLTPVPKTPAPEAIARFVDNLSPLNSESPCSEDNHGKTNDGDDDDDDRREKMLTRTCPPKRQVAAAFGELGEGILSKEKDERVLMRLMAARRKSLQFAPKVGSPLAKSWR